MDRGAPPEHTAASKSRRWQTTSHSSFLEVIQAHLMKVCWFLAGASARSSSSSAAWRDARRGLK